MIDDDATTTESERDAADLSALLDGELPAEREAELRARIAADPRLAERLARLGEVDAGLRALPGPELALARLERMQARLEARIASGTDDEGAFVADAIPLRRRAGAWAAAAAALAAGLALYLAGGHAPTPMRTLAPTLAPVLDDEEIAIALDYETLEDLEVIAQLELLELLDELDAIDRM